MFYINYYSEIGVWNIKKLRFYFICFFISFIVTSCDFFSDASITIVNESSYNLKINIEYKNLPSDHYAGYEEIHIRKGESVLFHLGRIGGMGVEPRNPNNDIINIIFANFDTNEIIKEIEINNLFKLISLSKYRANYSFEVTDDLLF